MQTRIIILFAFLINAFYHANARHGSLKSSHHYTITDGLAHNGVTCILEDSRGFMWIGTYDGLNRYDGYEFKTIKNTVDHTIFVSNRIRTINEDRNGNFWIGTDEGITIYNYYKGYSKNIYSNKLLKNDIKGPIVKKIIISNTSDRVYCTTIESGLLVFNTDYQFIEKIIPVINANNNIALYDCNILDSNNLILTSSVGILHLNLTTKNFSVVQSSSSNYQENFIYPVKENTLLASLGNGLDVITFMKNNNDYTFSVGNKHFNQYRFTSASVDNIGNLWLATAFNGIVHITDVNTLLNNKPLKQKWFIGQSGYLRASFINTATSHGCWLGAYDKGIFRFNLNDNPFHAYNTNLRLKYGPTSDDIKHISALDDNRAYIKSNHGGLTLYNTLTHSFEPIPFNTAGRSLEDFDIVYVDSRKDVWLSIIHEGIYRVKKNTNTVKRVTTSTSDFDYILLKTLTEDNEGNIWFGGLNNLYRIVLNEQGKVVKTESFNNHPVFKNIDNFIVRCIYPDPEYNLIWIGTDASGLFRIELNDTISATKLSVSQYIDSSEENNAISSSFVTSVIRLPNGQLWIGTERGGICKVIESDRSPKFISFTEKNGLSNNVVKDIWYDEEYNLWISTNIGLNMFDTKTNRFRTFGKEDGLPFEDFWYASEKLENGLVIMSGYSGFCYFNPTDVSKNEPLPKLVFDNIKLFNTTILPGDTVGDRVLLNSRLDNINEIILKHNENVFTIELTSLHYSNPNNHFIRYQLWPNNLNWIKVPSNQRFINYNGLQAGTYEFRVMVSNSLDEWTEPRTLKITITPPFWTTKKAYVLYFISGSLIIFIVVFFILRIQSLNHNLQIEQLEKDNVKEVNSAKLRFFSNISHEIKTPITLISGPIDLLINRFKGNQEVNEKLQIVLRQSKRISQLIDQVHDFQRSDANLLTMNSTRFCFDDFIHEVLKDYEFKAKTEKKKLIGKGEDSRIYVLADKDKIEKVFNNLLSNSFKYTDAHDTITIEYKRDGNVLLVKVTDTGQGIDPEDLPHIFERFYQSKSNKSEYTGGSGIGLAFTKRLIEMHYGYIEASSQPGKGTVISLRLPIIRSGINDQQSKLEEQVLSAEIHYNNELLDKGPDMSKIEISDTFREAMIFLCEDNTDMRIYIAEILSKYFKVREFSNGKECIDALEKEWPDIIISDILMPQVNGFDLCKKVKSEIKTSHIPVILLTACTSTDDQLQGLKEGADAYIKKPFNMEHLVVSVESILKGRNQLRDRYKKDFPLKLEKHGEGNHDIAFLEKLVNLIDQNLDNQQFELTNLTRELYINRTHFYQKVKALTGQTPYEFLKTYRLKKAAEYLIEENKTINEVVELTGFKSRAHFSKLFKEYFKTPPGRYISNARKS